MDLTLDNTQEMIRDGARRLLTDTYDADTAREVEATSDSFAADLWTQMTELGWTALALPEAAGGGGCGLVDLTVLAEELGRAATSTPLAATAGFSAAVLQTLDSTPTTDDLLNRLATTSAVMVPALAEPEGRDERTTPGCLLSENDDGATVSGTKIMVPYASVADVLFVSASTAHGEPAIVAVDTSADGVSTTRHRAIGGHPVFRVELESVSVAPNQVLARGEASQRALDAALDAATVLATAEAVGNCEAMLQVSAAYAANREQFGQPIGKFQAVAHKLSDMRINTDACRLLAAEAAWLIDQGHDATLDVASTKVFANEVVVDMVHAAHAVHGAIGYTNEYDLQLFTRRARMFCLSHGDTDVQTERAAMALGL